MPKDFKIENSELITVFSKDIFRNKVQEISHPKYDTIDSYFSDAQAKHICFKMSNNRIRHFSNLFLTSTSNIDTLTLRYQIHYLANKALEFYGGRILTFIFKLSNWPIRTTIVEVLKMNPSEIYDFDTTFSKLQLQSSEYGKSFTIMFTRAYEREAGSNTALKITNTLTNKTVRVSINGQLIEDFENCIPEIIIFKESLNGILMLYSGYDDGLCDICGKRLNDPVSIKYGRGPICRVNYGNP